MDKLCLQMFAICGLNATFETVAVCAVHSLEVGVLRVAMLLAWRAALH